MTANQSIICGDETEFDARCSAPLATVDPDVAVMRDVKIFERLCQRNLERAKALQFDATAEALDALLTDFEDTISRFVAAVADERDSDSHTVSGIAREQRGAGWRQR